MADETLAVEAPPVEAQRSAAGPAAAPGGEARPAGREEGAARLGQLEARLAALEEERDHYRQKAIQLDKQVFEKRALLQAGKGFSEILNLEALLQAFMSVCRERYDATSSAVLLLDDLDPERVFYRVRAYHGLPDRFPGPDGMPEEILLFKIPQDQGLLWQMIQQGDVFSVRDMQKLPRFRTAFEKWNLAVLNADVWVPLMRGSVVLGILTLGEGRDGLPIPEEDYPFLKEIAAVAATNIDSTLKYEKNARILSNLRTLYDINQQLANVNDFKRLTIETLATAVSALRAQKANLMLYNRETRRLEIKVVWGNIPRHTRDAINDGRLATRSFAVGEGVAGTAAKTGKPVRVNDRARIAQVGRNLVYCILSVPLLYGGEVMGVMTLTNKVKEDDDGRTVVDRLGRFGEEDEQLMLGLADQAAVNLHKARLYSDSITDRLTGLYNTRHFESRLEFAVGKALDEGEPLSLAVIDIDHFKRFNDTHGHKAGDAVLARIAEVLRETAGEDQRFSCYRYGGEEFCLLMPGTPEPAAARIVDRFRERVAAATVEVGGVALSATVSAGVAAIGEDAPSPGALFRAADEALYAAKRAGRNRVVRTEEAGEASLSPERAGEGPA